MLLSEKTGREIEICTDQQNLNNPKMNTAAVKVKILPHASHMHLAKTCRIPLKQARKGGTDLRGKVRPGSATPASGQTEC